MKYNWNKELIEQYVKESDSLSETLIKMNIPIQGNNSKTLKNKIEEYNIDISHFTYGNAKRSKTEYIPAEKYLTKNSILKSSKLKIKLLKEKIKENKCECCGISEWRGKPITIQLHHIDGDNTNNELSNLMMLCPNCHSQTDNYCGSANEKQHYYCKDCGKEITKGATYCQECCGKHARKVKNRPSKEELIEDFKIFKAITKIGEKYGVTDTTIRKWFTNYDLPSKSKELKELLFK